VPESLAIDTPGGLLFSRTQTRTATIEPLTGFLEAQTDTITVNGRTSLLHLRAGRGAARGVFQMVAGPPADHPRVSHVLA
jgi:hypothetical protein